MKTAHTVRLVVASVLLTVIVVAQQSCIRKTPKGESETAKPKDVSLVEIDDELSILIRKAYENPENMKLSVKDRNNEQQGIYHTSIERKGCIDSFWLAWNYRDTSINPPYVEFTRFCDTAVMVSYKKDLDNFQLIGKRNDVYSSMEVLSEMIDN